MAFAQLDRYKARAEIIKALSHPARLFIVDELAKGERCVGDLAEMLALDISTVSRHLAILRAGGIVSSRKEGNTVFHSLSMPCVLRFFTCAEAVLRRRLEESKRALADRAR